VLAVAAPVGLDLLLVLVDVAALPVPVGPLGQHRRLRARRVEERAQPAGRRRLAEQVHPQRPGRHPRRHRDLVAEVEARTVALALQPRGPAARRAHPGDGRVVALRDAADVEHVGRAVGTRVAAVGAELDGAAGLVDVQAVTGAEPDEALLGMPLPSERGAQMARGGRELDGHVVGAGDPHAQARRAPVAEPERELPVVQRARADGRDRVRERLGRDDALRELHELVVVLAGVHDHAESADDAPAAAPDRDRERRMRDLDLERPAREPQHPGSAGHPALVPRRPPPPRDNPVEVHGIGTSRLPNRHRSAGFAADSLEA
jgi:hypothetical protein